MSVPPVFLSVQASPVKISHKKDGIAKGGLIDFMFLVCGPKVPLTRQLDPLLLRNLIPLLAMPWERVSVISE